MIESQSQSGQLPPGWVLTHLGDIAEVVLGQSPPSSTYNEAGKGLPFYQGKLEFGGLYPTPRKWCATPQKVAKKGDVLISVRAPVGPTNICPDKSCIGRGLAAIRGLGGIGTLFVLYLLRAFESEIARKGTGTTFSAIGGDKLKGLDIPLPPLNEQVRIVARIEELFTRLDAGVEGLRKVKAQLKRYRQAVLKYAFEGKLTEEWRKTHRDQIETTSFPPRQANDANSNTASLPQLPDGWRWIPLPDLGELNRGKSKHRPRDDKRLFGGKYPFIQTGDIRNSNGLVTSYTQTYNELGLKQSKLWPVGSLCITIAANIAETAMLGILACFPDSVVGFIADEKVCMTKYVHFFVKNIRRELDSYAPATAQKNINLAILGNVMVPLAPLPEQSEIVAQIERQFSVADEIEETTELSLKQSKRLHQSILRMAFEGKLVPQDPSDEPAERLLESIREERAKSKGEKDKNKWKRRKMKPKQLELSTYVK